MIDGIYQSLIVFFMTYLLFANSTFETANGHDLNGAKQMGIFIASSAVVVVNLYILFNSNRWDWLMLLITGISVMLIWLCTRRVGHRNVSTLGPRRGPHKGALPEDFAYLRTAVPAHPTRLRCCFVTYAEFEKRGWHASGGAERANYNGFIDDLCDLLAVPRPDPTTDDPAQDAYVIERAVTFNNGAGKGTTGRIDLYKRDCFVLETKQGTTRRTTAVQAERARLGLSNPKLRKGHAVRGTAKWQQVMEAARQQALGYVRALPAGEPRPPFVVVADVGYCFDVYSNFAGVGDNYAPFPDSQRFRVLLPELADAEVRARFQLLFTDPQRLDPARLAAKVTRALAGQLAELSPPPPCPGPPSWPGKSRPCATWWPRPPPPSPPGR